jgi:hypothetical protein
MGLASGKQRDSISQIGAVILELHALPTSTSYVSLREDDTDKNLKCQLKVRQKVILTRRYITPAKLWSLSVKGLVIVQFALSCDVNRAFCN